MSGQHHVIPTSGLPLISAAAMVPSLSQRKTFPQLHIAHRL